MTEQQTLLSNPLFHYGMPAMSAAIVLAVGFLFFEPGLVRNVVLLIAALELVVAPQLLKRAGEQAAAQ
jgi:hypothetical protein